MKKKFKRTLRICGKKNKYSTYSVPYKRLTQYCESLSVLNKTMTVTALKIQ